jgi:hypothetical protein
MERLKVVYLSSTLSWMDRLKAAQLPFKLATVPAQTRKECLVNATHKYYRLSIGNFSYKYYLDKNWC